MTVYRRRQNKNRKAKRNLKYPSLWHGCVGAWCPSVTGPTGGTLYDLSGYSNNGILTNMDPASDWVNSDGQQVAIDTDGSNDSIALPDNYYQGYQTGTLTAWVLFKGNGSGGNVSPIISLGGTASGDYVFAFRRREADIDRVDIRIYPSPDIQVKTTSGLSVDNRWYHIAWGSDGSQYSVYFDGVLQSLTGSNSGEWIGDVSFSGNTTCELAAQSYNGSPFSYSQLQLDDVRLYNRQLTHNEIMILSRERGIAYAQAPETYSKASPLLSPKISIPGVAMRRKRLQTRPIYER